jgi:Fe-S-cluster-containing hydrogenase component 2
VFPERLRLEDAAKGASPCESCAEQPCLRACPVDAFGGAAYDVAACVGHLGRAAGRDCMVGGCLARQACPLGGAFQYGSEQARFHMERFLRDQTGAASRS